MVREAVTLQLGC